MFAGFDGDGAPTLEFVRGAGSVEFHFRARAENRIKFRDSDFDRRAENVVGERTFRKHLRERERAGGRLAAFPRFDGERERFRIERERRSRPRVPAPVKRSDFFVGAHAQNFDEVKTFFAGKRECLRLGGNGKRVVGAHHFFISRREPLRARF